MVRNTRRGSYFYVIDAFIASIIIITTLFILFSRFISQQPATQAFFTAEDFLSTIETTRVVTNTDPRIAQWIADGNITDTQATIIEQLVQFKLGNMHDTELAAIIAASAPQKVGMTIKVNEETLYSDPRGAQSIDEAAVVLVAKRVVVLKSSPKDIYPPAIVEVSTWQ